MAFQTTTDIDRIPAEHLYAELGEVVTGRQTGRDGEDEVIVVRTEGMVSQDVALAHWVYEEAKRLQLLAPAL